MKGMTRPDYAGLGKKQLNEIFDGMLLALADAPPTAMAVWGQIARGEKTCQEFLDWLDARDRRRDAELRDAQFRRTRR